jgi:integrase
MKLLDREPVEGTKPVIYIGHRPYLDKRNQCERACRTWYAEYCFDGKSRSEALRTNDRGLAIKRSHSIVHRLEDGQGIGPTRRIDLAAARDAYLEMQRNRNRSRKTLDKYGGVLTTLVDWALQHGIRRAERFGERDLWAFHRKMVDDELAPKTCYVNLTIVKQLFRWAARTRLIWFNPLAAVVVDRPPQTLQPCFSPEQVGRLLASADRREYAIFAMMAYAGLRFGEVRDLCWSDVLLDRGQHGFIAVQRGGSGCTTKSRRMRLIPIHPVLRNILDGLAHESDHVFTARPSRRCPEGGQSINERSLLMSLKRLCRECEFINPDQYKLHTFRHTFASMCARSNISYKYALEWMGHTSSDILDLYYTMYDDAAQAAIRTVEYPLESSTS